MPLGGPRFEDARLVWMELRLEMLLQLAGVTRPVMFHVSQDQIPGTPLRHAWTMPAEQMALGPGGTVVIVFYIKAVNELPSDDLLHIMAHEVMHAKHDYDAILAGKDVCCAAADLRAFELLGSPLRGLLQEAA